MKCARSHICRSKEIRMCWKTNSLKFGCAKWSKIFLPLLLKLPIVALGHRLDLYNRLEIALFHPKTFSGPFILIYNFFNIQKIHQKHCSNSTIRAWKQDHMIHNHISPIAFFSVHSPWSTIHTMSQRSQKTQFNFKGFETRVQCYVCILMFSLYAMCS